MSAQMFSVEEIAPGVRGYTIENERGLYIPVVWAVNEGNGDVSRFLDTLPRDRRVVFPTVISKRLAEMLLRRGFVWTQEWSDEFGEAVDLLERVPA